MSIQVTQEQVKAFSEVVAAIAASPAPTGAVLAALQAHRDTLLKATPGLALADVQEKFDAKGYVAAIGKANALLDKALAGSGIARASVAVDDAGIIILRKIGGTGDNPRGAVLNAQGWGFKTHSQGADKGKTYLFRKASDTEYLLYGFNGMTELLEFGGSFESLSSATMAAGWKNSGGNDIQPATSKAMQRAIDAIAAAEKKTA